ncbi:hypothetical protein Bca4012_073102 [Brassica carinata]|uniref:(rape) hypothetical protein n=1 Tax=Brassica napus TaxID=3708 RepID=A0A816LFU9_BRANA|nr:unnamed protein product [Brassica napus]
MEIIKQTSDFVARTIPTLGDPTVTDIDIIVKIPNHSLDAVRRIDLDVYFIELCENRREPTPSEKDDICPISCEEFGTEREINSLNSARNVHDHFRRSVTEVRREGAVEFVGVKVEALKPTRPSSRPVTEVRREGGKDRLCKKLCKHNGYATAPTNPFNLQILPSHRNQLLASFNGKQNGEINRLNPNQQVESFRESSLGDAFTFKVLLYFNP